MGGERNARGPTAAHRHVEPGAVKVRLNRQRLRAKPASICHAIAFGFESGPGRYSYRDATMILMAYLHGLRVSEFCALPWVQLEFGRGELHVTRRKRGKPAVHTLRGSGLRALRRLQREQSGR